MTSSLVDFWGNEYSSVNVNIVNVSLFENYKKEKKKKKKKKKKESVEWNRLYVLLSIEDNVYRQ